MLLLNVVLFLGGTLWITLMVICIIASMRTASIEVVRFLLAEYKAVKTEAMQELLKEFERNRHSGSTKVN